MYAIISKNTIVLVVFLRESDRKSRLSGGVGAQLDLHREIGKTYLKASDEAKRERSVYIFGMGTVSLAISMRGLEVLGPDT